MQIPAIALSGPRLTTFLLQLGVLLGLALLLGRLAAWLRMPAIAGELLAGIVLGPTVLGRPSTRAASSRSSSPPSGSGSAC